ncbi:MAG: eL32 family ribosomal protein [archaeon]|nr:eL32 family ribosomal protein [archaeon]
MTGFLRRAWMRTSKLGRKRKKEQKWRRPKGRDNKMREKRRSYPKTVMIGYGSPKKLRGKIGNDIPMIINNVADLSKLKENNIAIISANVGKKKRIEILKKAEENKIKILNTSLKKIQKKTGEKK